MPILALCRGVCLTVVLAMGVACAGDGSDDGAEQEQMATTAVADIPRRLVEADATLANVTPTRWQSASVGPDDRTITVRFLVGPAGCGQLARHDVVLEVDRVIVTLFVGDEPADGRSVCTAVGRPAQTVIDAGEAVAGRPVVDGNGRPEG